ncbi:hypothetical protein K458DRAFT_389860 [Lentithecium fluviatile CBS 122367]|uniref:Cytochrome P450 n=1 Tax=Lentithecium fluviatile CBS 122367 TaxID=1168545 RepID=A0A6G1IYC4_9PLEO|nr:hypothetical protein K458DRAFT_389860 [Lentithecium fluviatile CBS 122367]
MLRKQGLPMPPHNIFLGQLGLAASIQKTLPSNAHGHFLADQIRQRYPDLGPTFYLDLWPFSDPMLIITDPDGIAQFSFGMEMGLLTLINPMRYFHMWNNRRIMDKYIDRDLDNRYDAMESDAKGKTIIDLALSG